jgi:hypothetical protein
MLILKRALAFGHHEDRTPTHGYEPTREAAMAVEAGARRAAPPAPGATQLGQRARGVVSLPLRTSHGRGV